MRSFLAITAILMLSGCGLIQHAQQTQVDRTHYRQSLADYRACLAASGANPQACEGKRLLLETDEKTLDNDQIKNPSENYDITVRNR